MKNSNLDQEAQTTASETLHPFSIMKPEIVILHISLFVCVHFVHLTAFRIPAKSILNIEEVELN